MNGRVPDPDWFEFDVLSDTNSACPPADCPGARAAVAALTAAFGTHGDDFAVLASTTQGVGVHDFVPDAVVVQLVDVHDFAPDPIAVVQVVDVHDFVPAAAAVEQLVEVHDFVPDEVEQLVELHDFPLDDELHGGVELPGGEDEWPLGGVVVDDDLQPVWAGFVLPMPWLRSHS